MANNENLIPIPGRLHSVATEGHVAGANEIYDDTLAKDQATINSEVNTALGTGGTVDQKIEAALEDVAFIDDSSSSPAVVPEFDPESQTVHVTAQTLSEQQKAQVRENIGLGDVDAKINQAVASEASQRAAAVSAEQSRAQGVESTLQANIDAEALRAQAAEADRYTKSETYTKEEVHNLITTPNQEYETVTATDQTTAVTDVLPATGSADTTYRVGNWDGTQYNDSVFSEYAWNGSAYIKLSTKSQIGEVYDISANHADTKYADLAAALGVDGANIPQSLQKGGMSIKFVQSSDNNYKQFRCISDEFTVDVTKWAFCCDDIIKNNPEFIDILLSKNKKVLETTDVNGKKTFYGDMEVKGKLLGDISESIGTDNEPTPNSEKPIKSGGVAKTCGFNTSSPEYVDVLYDNEKKLLETTDIKGKKTIYGDCEIKGALEAEVPHKMQVILDMDYGGDCDDAYALRLVGYYHSIGKIDVKMISSCYKNTPRVMGMLAQADYDGLGGIPVVAGDYEIETEPIDNYGANATQIFPHSRIAPDGVGISAFRKYLSQIKGKCTICTTGHLYNISDLINSEPDEWSPLNGNQLINEKVERFVVMGGRYDSNDYQYEFNFCDRTGSKEATLNFFANVSVPIYLCGFELCVDKYIGKDWNTNLDTNDKFRELEARFVEIWGSDITTVGRQAPDPLTVMFMCNDLGKNIGMPVTRGVVSLNSNAYTKFTANNSGTHYLMSCIYAPSDYEWRMNTLLWRKSW